MALQSKLSVLLVSPLRSLYPATYFSVCVVKLSFLEVIVHDREQ